MKNLPSGLPHPVCSDDWLDGQEGVGGSLASRLPSMSVLQQAQLERRGHAGYKVVIKEKRGADSVSCHETGEGGQWIGRHSPAHCHHGHYVRHR